MASINKKYSDVESVLEMIRTREQMGLPLSSGSLHTGSHADPDLHRAGIGHCGTWQKAVELAGFDYQEMLVKARSRYPSAAAVLREIANRHKNGLSLTASDVGRRAGPNRDSQLHAAAARFFGTWVKALEAADIDYVQYLRKQNRKYPHGDSVVAEILRRESLGLGINLSSINSGSNRDPMLRHGALDYFGSWRKAVEAAGVDYAKVNKRTMRKYADGAAVIEAIQQRAAAGMPLNPPSLGKGKNRDKSLLDRGREYFGGWENALVAAGIDLATVPYRPQAGPRKPRAGEAPKYKDEGSVLEAIRKRSQDGLPLNSLAVAKGECRDGTLYRWGGRFFGSWEKAVEAAGFNYADCVAPPVREYPDGESVLAEIRRRHAAGLPVNSLAVAKGEHGNERLYRSGQQFFPSWREAVETVGIDYAQHQRDRLRMYPDRAAVVAQITKRQREGLSLNGVDLSRGKERDVTLYNSGREYFGSWRAALEAAGIDPETVFRLPLPKKNCWD